MTRKSRTPGVQPFLIDREQQPSYDVTYEVTHTDPESAYAYIDRGNAYAKREAFELAVSEFSQALRIPPANPAKYDHRPYAYNHRGASYLELRKYPEAMADFRESMGLKPEFTAPLYNLGRALAQQEKYAEAVSEFTKAIQLEEDPHLSVSYYQERGLAYLLAGQKEEARADFSQVVSLSPRFAFGHYCLGLTLNEQGNPRQALLSLSKAAELEPIRLPQIYQTRALVYAALGNSSSAMADVDRFKQLTGDAPQPSAPD